MNIFYFYILPVLIFLLGIVSGYYCFRLKVYLLKKYHYRLGFNDGFKHGNEEAKIILKELNLKER